MRRTPATGSSQSSTKRPGRASALLLLLALLPACVSIEQECRGGKWHEIGRYHGDSGYPQDFVEKYLQSCPPLGVTPDEEALQAGWEAGNSWYCRPESIGAEARTGSLASFPEVCQWRQEELWSSYVRGRCSYLASQIPSNEQSLAKLQQKFEDAREKVKKAQIHFLIIGLRGAIHGLRSEFVDLGCGL